MTSGAAASAPQPEQCALKKQLTNQLRAVVDRQVALSVRERKASVANAVEQLEWIARELEKVRQREIALLNEYQKHVQAHRC